LLYLIEISLVDEMFLKNTKFLYIVLFFGSIVLYFLYKSTYNNIREFHEINGAKKYQQECIKLFEKIRNPKNGTIFRPPLKEIPKELYNLFTQNGSMPVRRYWYFNDAYSDSVSNSNLNKNKPIVSKQELNNWRDMVKKHQPLNYANTELQRIMFKYSKELENKNIAIIGTQPR
jgi:hypothetical protein